MVITASRLDEIVALEPATKDGRIVMQWNKEDSEEAGLIKLDLLGLGMLAAISDMVKQVEAATGVIIDINALPLDDPAIFDMLCSARAIGTFQVESPAQLGMHQRHKPRCFNDIIVSIAIIRPGPIQGNMVHPYLKRRAGAEAVTYPHPLLEEALSETLGVILYQEQVLKVAMQLAGFTGGEADLLRRALSRNKPDEIDMLRSRFVAGAQKQGVDTSEADKIFTLLSGYAGFGFCKSHSASFALIAYWSLWFKCYYPAEFFYGLLKNQPMGFYHPEVLLEDARRHGVDILPPDINLSGWEYEVVYDYGKASALRTGLKAVLGMGKAAWERIKTAREHQPFPNLRDVLKRAGLPKGLISNLIQVGALDGMGKRRELLWELGPLDERSDGLDLQVPIISTTLPELTDLEATIWEYELMGHSPDGQLLRHYREKLRQTGIMSTWQVKHEAMPGMRIRVGGMVVVRQQPATAKGILFIRLEDESGLIDLVVKPDVYARQRSVLRHQPLIIATGIVQRVEGATSVLVLDAMPLIQ
jgi:error-prone DNA polymerase